MKINILLFGSLAEITGEPAISLATDTIVDVDHLHQYMLEKYPALRGKTFRYAVNQEIAGEKHNLHEGDEVALLPPFSGG